MRLMVSACLLGENCKYNGSNNKNEKVLRFIDGHEVIPVCPEMMGGLPVPRKPAEICQGNVMTEDGESVDRSFRKGAAMARDLAVQKEIDLAILQPRSPSCGCKQIYDGTFSRKLIEGKGVFAQMLHDAGIKTLEPDDLNNLNDNID